MRVVLDANVFVSGAIQKGPSFRIVQRWLSGRDFEVMMCPELLAEITDVRPSVLGCESGSTSQ